MLAAESNRQDKNRENELTSNRPERRGGRGVGGGGRRWTRIDIIVLNFFEYSYDHMTIQ